MYTFKKITKANGFDAKDLTNAVQNSYSWCMAELGDYIYVGTARNLILLGAMTWGGNVTKENLSDERQAADNNAEIWRYKKGSKNCKWERVFKANPTDNISGFRAMITHKSGHTNALYAAGVGQEISLFKSTDGIHWRKVDTSNVSGKSSRALVSYNNKLYIATLEGAIGGNIPLLYSSTDPEKEPFKSVIDTEKLKFNKYKNPVGGIDELIVFNKRLYVGISTENGAEIWKSDDCNPRTNHWSKVCDKGFGDKFNSSIMSSGVFKDHLYVAVSKKLPLALFMPLGFDLIRIDKYDNYEVVVGGKPMIPSDNYHYNSLSGFKSGFDSFFNVYGWQIKSYKDNLFITTCDFSTNIKLIIDALSKNEDSYIKNWGSENYNNLLKSYKKIYNLLLEYDYPMGFDIYSSKDGCNFKTINLNGLGNKNNYGGRTLLVSCEDELYLGTANPTDGTEVWKVNIKPSRCNLCDTEYIDDYYCDLEQLNKELIKIYPTLLEALSHTFLLNNQ